MDERHAMANTFEKRFAELTSNIELDTLHLRALLYEVATALSPPRPKCARNAERVCMDDLAAECLQKSALIQKSLRKIVSSCISLWRDQLQLEDEQIEPI